MPLDSNPLTFYGRNIIQDYHASLKARLPSETAHSTSFGVGGQRCLPPEQKVGIIGAGVGGLYAALILDSLDIEYEVLEASNRTGGRIFTYKFQGGGKYDYYDAGAMRFPFPKKDSQGRYKNGAMKRLAELTEYGPLNQGQDRLKDSLIPFYFKARDGSAPGSYYYNGVREAISNTPRGPFGAQDMGIDADYIRSGADAIISDVIQPFTRMIMQDIETGQRKGWEILKANDSHTIWSYMANEYLPSAHLELPPEHLPNNVINWCRLLAGAGPSDASLVEAVFFSLASIKVGESGDGSVDWRCFEGGSQTLTKKMEEYLNRKGHFVQFNKRVTAISQGHTAFDVPVSSTHQECRASAEEPSDDASVSVTVNGGETRNYPHVITTIPLSILRTVDLSGAGLNTMQKTALGSQKYFFATKIAILFKSNWWTTRLGIIGGQSFTDLPICAIVYPSYGVDSSTPSNVLIASYCSKDDAVRLGVLAAMKDREVLLELVLRNLAEAHSGLHPDVTYEFLKEEFIDMHVQDWARDEYAMGAAAVFEPGDFQRLYPSLTYPAAGKRLHFAGEAVSTHHSWVVGALDSSWRAVYEYLKVTGQDEKMKTFKALWGGSSEWDSRSPEVEASGGVNSDGPDLMDEHLGLVDRAIRVSYPLGQGR